jgi:hypothetical protein
MALRLALQGLKRGVQSTGAPAVQKRFASDLYYKPNKHVEAWGKRREDLEFEFQWDNQNTRKVVTWGVVIPIALYSFIAWSSNLEDDWAERPRRSFLFAEQE